MWYATKIAGRTGIEDASVLGREYLVDLFSRKRSAKSYLKKISG
jgi:hypothetical protein